MHEDTWRWPAEGANNNNNLRYPERIPTKMMTTMTSSADAQFMAKMAKELAEATRVVCIEKSGGQTAIAPAWPSEVGAAEVAAMKRLRSPTYDESW